MEVLFKIFKNVSISSESEIKMMSKSFSNFEFLIKNNEELFIKMLRIFANIFSN